MNKISYRLKEIANLVKENEIIADVGSDHGQLPIYLFKKGIIKKAYAIDNKVGPYNGLIKNVKDTNSNIVCLLSNGIDDIPNDVNTLVLAGLGTNTIIQILSNKAKLANIKSIITDAHTDLYSLREYISKLGFKIVDEIMINDMKIFYTIIRFELGDSNYDYDDLFFGPILKNTQPEIFKSYWINRKNYLSNLLENVTDKTKYQNMKLEIERISKIL